MILESENYIPRKFVHIWYGTAQWQLDTRMRVNVKKRAGRLNEYMPNPRRCPSRFKSVMVRLLRSLVPTKIYVRHLVIEIVITHRYAARDAQYRLFMLAV